MNTTKPSRSSTKTLDVTLPGGASGAEGGDPTEGEMNVVGSSYRAIITERENKSLNRNAGPTRPSANPGMIPMVRQSQRKTGRV